MTLVLDHKDKLSQSSVRLGVLGINAAIPGANLEVPDDPMGDDLDKAQALKALYFPALVADFAALRQRVQEFRTFITREVEHTGADIATWDRDLRPTYGGRSADALQSMSLATFALMQSARRIIETDLADAL